MSDRLPPVPPVAAPHQECEHTWAMSMIQMPEGYSKPGATMCTKCGAFYTVDPAPAAVAAPLSERWRGRASISSISVIANTYRQCADELDAELAAARLTVQQLTQELKESRELNTMMRAGHLQCDGCARLQVALDAERALRQQLLEALDRTRQYIAIAMRPISIKEACGETAYERAERRGLQHGLNAINAEFANVEALAEGRRSAPAEQK